MSFFRYPERKFDPCPAGMHPAVCVDVVDMGDVAGQYGIKPKVRIVFQIGDIDPSTGRRFNVAAFYTNSLHKKSKLRTDLSDWAGRPLTEDECKKLDPERLIGKNCLILVVHAAGEDGTIYANIKALAPALKGATRLAPPGLRASEGSSRLQAADEDWLGRHEAGRAGTGFVHPVVVGCHGRAG